MSIGELKFPCSYANDLDSWKFIQNWYAQEEKKEFTPEYYKEKEKKTEHNVKDDELDELEWIVLESAGE